MYKILSASKDTYITNKIIDNSFRATDANVGQAATLDLFKLYAESTSGSDDTPIELSRGLVKFDLSELSRLRNTKLDISHSSFQCLLKLSDVYGGQTTPSNFKMIVFPLAQQFDEGIGRDIIRYSDLDATNYITASVSNGTLSTWNLEGAMKSGSLSESNIDIIVSGNLGAGIVNLSREQTFITGREDLEVDITPIVSGVLTSQIPDCGFLFSYSGSYEKDQKTYFVKRFASRESLDAAKRPKIIVKYNDAIQDNHRNFIFNATGSLFLNNFHRGQPANIISNTGATLSGHNCIALTLKSGSFSKIVTGSQFSYSSAEPFLTGVYSASLAISEYESLLKAEIISAASATFVENWGSLGDAVGFLTGSLVINANERTGYFNTPNRILATITNLQSSYTKNEEVRIRVFAEDRDRPIKYKKLPIELPSEIFTKMHYRVRNFNSGDIIIPFDTANNSTLMSTDSQGMFFDFYMSSLTPGLSYVFEILIIENNFEQVVTNLASKFIIENR
jgi:hypothetical protein